MKNVFFKVLTIMAMVAVLASCKKDEPKTDPVTGDVTTEVTYGGKDSDDDYLTMILTTVTTKEGTTKSQTYDLFWGESKKDPNYEKFSDGKFTYENGGAILSCKDNDGETSFMIVVDGKKLKYNNGEIGEDYYAFELTKK
ncbi:MAG: hypothetical protein MJ010_00945 [Paludibacteraceae bacterium]|nr:hypothetical protein [Paludibacteraceae bacterium]